MILARGQSVKIGLGVYPVVVSVLQRGRGLNFTKLSEQNRNLDTFYPEPVPLCAIFNHTRYMKADMKITNLDTFYREPVPLCAIFQENSQSDENTLTLIP